MLVTLALVEEGAVHEKLMMLLMIFTFFGLHLVLFSMLLPAVF